MDLRNITTPALILDRVLLENNCKAMTDRVKARGLNLRPHLKTAKSIDAAQRALAGNFGGVTVATLNEAEYFEAHGLRDILYAVCVTPDKLDRAAAMMQRGARLSLITDDASMARILNERGAALGVVFEVLVEIDSGEHRTGVDPLGDELLKIAGILNESPHTRLCGVLTHAGHAYHCRTRSAIVEVAEQERRSAAAAADRIRQAGSPCPIVSIGSTPTAVHGVSSEGVTEVRAGVYMFGDLFQADIQSCRPSDIAVSVLTTVISQNHARGQLVVDAGALALSKDRGTGRHGYGRVIDRCGRALVDELIVREVHQEHGEITGEGPLPFDRFAIGSRVRILPNHACMTTAMYDRYHVVAGHNDTVQEVWAKTGGWL